MIYSSDQTDDSAAYIFTLAFYTLPLLPTVACDTNELQIY